MWVTFSLRCIFLVSVLRLTCNIIQMFWLSRNSSLPSKCNLVYIMAVGLQRNPSCIYVICNYLKSPVPWTSIIGQQLDMISNIILECPQECIVFPSAAHFIFRFVWRHFTTRLLFISKQHRWDTSQKNCVRIPTEVLFHFYGTAHFV